MESLKEYPLLGMVYDEDSQPCSGAWIHVDGRKGPQADLHGRFVINSLERGFHQIEVRKEGYETLTVPIEYMTAARCCT